MSHITLELAELVDLFCEGDIAPEQASRLEALVAESEQARQYLLDCFQVHCELAWEFGRHRDDSSQPAAPGKVPGAGNSRRTRRRAWALAAMAVALLVAATLGLTAIFRSGRPKTGPLAPSVARLEQVKDVRWCNDLAPAIDAPLPAGSKLALEQGLLEVVFQSGARMILQGPAEVELQSPSAAVLLRGKLTAEVPAEARGFAIHTPNATVVDLGTRFGVACQAGQTDVEVFLGKVLLRLDNAQSGGGPQELPITAKSAVRVNGVPGQGALKVTSLAAGSRNFVQSLAGSAALMQALAEGDPHLIHYYPFEGETKTDKLRDQRGNLDLHEVAMRDGGGGRLEFLRTGPDPSTPVLVPCRDEASGGVRGRGLQSQSVFQPPAAMTIELLLNFSRAGQVPEGFIACAVSTRNDADHCGFFVTAIRGGEMACLLNGGAEWLHSGFKFTPGRWYYVASTFRVKGPDTEVNTFAADLSDKTPNLNWVVRNQIAPGVPASGPLGVGIGFDGHMANAYPWAGQLGLVAIYDTVLESQTLEKHFRALSPHSGLQPDSAPAN